MFRGASAKSGDDVITSPHSLALPKRGRGRLSADAQAAYESSLDLPRQKMAAEIQRLLRVAR
jgi:hypothetical protein